MICNNEVALSADISKPSRRIEYVSLRSVARLTTLLLVFCMGASASSQTRGDRLVNFTITDQFDRRKSCNIHLFSPLGDLLMREYGREPDVEVVERVVEAATPTPRR